MFRLSQGAACGEASGVAREDRIQFPLTLHVYASTLDELVKDAFPGNLRLLNGHLAIYGWYVAMAEALAAQSEKWAASLW